MSHKNERGRVEMTNNERMPKQVVTDRMEGKGKKVTPWKHGHDEVMK